jgi:hypothetical protein
MTRDEQQANKKCQKHIREMHDNPRGSIALSKNVDRLRLIRWPFSV